MIQKIIAVIIKLIFKIETARLIIEIIMNNYKNLNDNAKMLE